MDNIRLAVPADIPDLVRMVAALSEAVAGAQAVDREWTAKSLAYLIAAGDAAVWIGHGFLAGQLRRTMINPAIVAIEHGWYSENGRSGIRLLRCFEAWAKAHGATAIHLSTPPTGVNLARLGYAATELAWVK